MKEIMSFVSLLIANILLYLIISFVVLEFDVMKWGIIERIIAVIGILYNTSTYLELDKD